MLKQLVRELSITENRVKFITDYLNNKNIEFSIQKYDYGKNIEIKKNGISKEKEIIIMAHHDVLNKNYENANDNTSSLAVLLFFAEYIKNVTLSFDLKIVFNDNEELLGALFSNNKSISFLEKIVEKSGSYFYLKNYASKKSKIIILELTGIGDCLYFAKSSGGIPCDKEINERLIKVAEKNNFKYSIIPIPQTDYISIHILKLSGTVLGSLPSFEYLNYKKERINNFYPDIWKRNHTSLDKVEALNEKTLQMVYTFLIKVIQEYK